MIRDRRREDFVEGLRRARAMAICTLLLMLAVARPVSAGADAPPLPIDNAIYSWWIHPLSVNDGDATWLGSIARLGTVRVFKVHRANGTQQEVRLGRLAADDHNGPAIAFDPGEKNLIVFFAGHGVDQLVHYRTVNRTTLALGPEQTLTFPGKVTYAQVLQRGAKIVLLTRVNKETWQYKTSCDWGESWEPAANEPSADVLLDGTGLSQVYLMARAMAEDDPCVRIVCCGHPTSSGYRRVRYADLDMDTGAVQIPGGIAIGDLDDVGGPALDPEEMSLVIDPSPGYKVRIFDVGTIADMPAISYAVWFDDGDDDHTDEPATYKIEIYRNGGWETAPGLVVASGEPFGYDVAVHYLGGLAIGRHGDRVFLSREANALWYVEQWHWNGSRFVFDKTIASTGAGDTFKLVRPYTVYRNGSAELTLDSIERYDSYTSYDSDVLVY